MLIFTNLLKIIIGFGRSIGLHTFDMEGAMQLGSIFELSFFLDLLRIFLGIIFFISFVGKAQKIAQDFFCKFFPVIPLVS